MTQKSAVLGSCTWITGKPVPHLTAENTEAGKKGVSSVKRGEMGQWPSNYNCLDFWITSYTPGTVLSFTLGISLNPHNTGEC